jgi:hypothetical protein
MKSYILSGIFIILFPNVFLTNFNYFSRNTFVIKEKEKINIGKKIRLFEIEGNIHKFIYIYILNEGNKYLEITHSPAEEYMDTSFKINRTRRIKNMNDTGIEVNYKVKIVIEERFYNFEIFGDITYIYLKDNKGNRIMNKDAIEFMIEKDKEIKEFIEIMACDKENFFVNFIYVFNDKKLINDLNINANKYEIKRKYFACTKEEEILGYNCDKYIQFPKK